MNKKRQQYSAEFKFQVVLEVLKEEKTVSEIASSYELNPNLILSFHSPTYPQPAMEEILNSLVVNH